MYDRCNSDDNVIDIPVPGADYVPEPTCDKGWTTVKGESQPSCLKCPENQ